MGTRSLTAIYFNNELKVAQYKQFDGYPTGLLNNLVKNLKEYNIDEIKEALSKTVLFKNEKEFNSFIKNELDTTIIGQHPITSRGFEEIYEKRKNLYSQLSYYDCNILEVLIQVHNIIDKIPLVNNISFINDSLFCEWAYVIDFDKNIIEVYTGFNKNPNANTGRFPMVLKADDDEYHTCRFIKSYDINYLTSLSEKEALELYRSLEKSVDE